MTASPSVQIFYKKQNCKLCQQKCTIRTKTVACISSEASEGHGDNIKRLCISKSFLGSNGVLRWLGGNINLGKSQESSTPIWEKSAQVRANEDDLRARKCKSLATSGENLWKFNCRASAACSDIPPIYQNTFSNQLPSECRANAAWSDIHNTQYLRYFSLASQSYLLPC